MKIAPTCLVACLAACFALPTLAFAQSSVVLYGSLDLSPLHVSNIGGTGSWKVNGGTTQPDKFGFRGLEDLGGGNAAIFQLEGGIAPDTGAQINATKFWNREAKVGLQSKDYGTLVLGHLTDTTYDVMGRFSNGFNLYNTFMFHPGNFDGLSNQVGFDNAAKYISPLLAGFQLYAAAGASEGTGRNTGVGLAYNNGGFRAGATYTKSNLRALDIAGRVGIRRALGRTFTPGTSVAMDSVEIYGIGAAYTMGAWNFNTNYTQNDIKLGAAHTKPKNFDLGVTWRPGGANAVYAGFGHSTFDAVKWNQFAIMDMYWLSKRTQVYAQATTQKATGGVAALNSGGGVSSTGRQTIVGVGLHTSF